MNNEYKMCYIKVVKDLMTAFICFTSIGFFMEIQ